MPATKTKPETFRREKVIDSVLVMTEHFVRNVVHSACESLGGSSGSRQRTKTSDGRP